MSKTNIIAWAAFILGVLYLGIHFLPIHLTLYVFVTVLVSMYLVRKTTEPFDFQKLSILSIWYLGFIALDFIPAFLVYSDEDGPARTRFLLCVASVLITVPLGAWLARRQAITRQTEPYFAGNFDEEPRSSFSRTYAIVMVVALLGTLLYLSETPVIPLFEWFRYDTTTRQLALLREDSFKLLDSRFSLLYYYLRNLIYPVWAAVGLGYFLHTRKTLWLGLWLGSLGGGLFYGALTLAKGPIAMLVMVSALFVYFYRGRKINLKLVLGSVVLFMAFPVAVLSLANGFSVTGALDAMVVRLFYLPSELLYYYFDIFPTQVAYLHGRSSPHLSALFGMQFFDTNNYVGLYYSPILASISAPAAFIGDLNADFGVPGVLLGGVAAGWIMQTVHQYLITRRKTIINVACYAFLVWAFMNLNVSAFPTVMASGGVLPVLLFARYLENRARVSLQLQPAAS
jgi:oligosaccharide repeat unit polymerase